MPAGRPRRARPAGAAARAALARGLARGGGDAHRLAVRLLAAVRLRGDLHVRGGHAHGRAPSRRAVARPRPAARAARPGGAARTDRPGRAGARRGRPPAPLGDDPRDRCATSCTTCCARSASSTSRRPANASSRASTPAPCCASWWASGARSACAWAGASATSPPTRRASTGTRSGPSRRGVCRRRSWRRWRTRSTQLVARYARTHGPFTTAQLHERYGVDHGPGAARARARGNARARRAAPRRQRARVVRRRGAAAPAPGLAGGAAQGDRARRGAPSGGLPAVLAGRRPPLRGRAPGSSACARCWCPCRGSRCRSRAGSATCCRAARAPTRPRGWTSCAPAASWRGWAPGRWDAPGAWRCTSARMRPRSAPPRSPDRRSRPAGVEHELLRACLQQGPCFFSDLLVAFDGPAEALREALWDLVWAGEVTNDAWAPLRAPRLTLAAAGEPARPGGASRPQRRARRLLARSRFGSRQRSGAQSQVQGRWSLTGRIFGAGLEDPARAPERRRALAELLLERYGIVTREQVLAENVRVASPACMTPSTTSRRSACAGAGTSSRAWAAPSSRSPARSSACARERRARVDARDRRHRPGPALRRGAAVAQARARARPPGARGGRLPGARRRSARAVPGARRAQPADADRGPHAAPSPGPSPSRAGRCGPRWERSPRRSARASCRASRWSGSTASRRWAARWQALLVELGFHSGPRRLTLSG